MQKMTKGAIAAAAAALLLVGGGGTFMSWNQDDTFDDSTITAGTLTLDTSTPGTWALNGDDVTDEMASLLIVPGDELVFTQPATISATGNNIQGELKVTPGTISAAGAADADTQLATALNASDATTFKIDTEAPGLTSVEFSDTYYQFLDAGDYEANLVATIDFGFDSVSDLVAQGGAVNLAGMKLSLQQTAPNAPGEVI